MTTPTLQSFLEESLPSALGQGEDLARLASEVTGLFQILVASDQMGEASIRRAQTGINPALPQGGQAQMAFVLYWIENEPERLKKFLKQMPEVQKLWVVVESIVKIVYPSRISKEQYAWALAQPDGIIAPDGSVLGSGTYEDFDDGWLWSFFNYLINILHPQRIAPFTPAGGGAPFSQPLQLCNGEARIVLIGDWGTGAYNAGGYDPATSVLETAMKLKPDYLIHLGDVYYAGTQDAPPPGEEHRNFLSMWPPMPPQRSFTLNSNHEMYGGANGYFNVSLGRGSATPTPFVHQNGYSYFALSCGDLAIVGLDAAYFDPSSMYMDGGLGPMDKDPQYAFLQEVAANHRQLILLTHQTALSMDGGTLLPLWSDVSGAIDASKIALWYWGHIHAGIAYDTSSAIGKFGVRAACCGHGAIPMGDPWGLQRHSTGVAWYAHTPVGGQAPANRVRNGFAMLTVSSDGVEEAFYNAGDLKPVWTRSH